MCAGVPSHTGGQGTGLSVFLLWLVGLPTPASRRNHAQSWPWLLWMHSSSIKRRPATTGQPTSKSGMPLWKLASCALCNGLLRILPSTGPSLALPFAIAAIWDASCFTRGYIDQFALNRSQLRALDHTSNRAKYIRNARPRSTPNGTSSLHLGLLLLHLPSQQ